MPRKEGKDPAKLTSTGKTYLSQQEFNRKWEKENPVDKIIVRIPSGKRELINKYVEDKAASEPGNRKYSTDKGRPSVNALIISLLEEEMGINLIEKKDNQG